MNEENSNPRRTYLGARPAPRGAGGNAFAGEVTAGTTQVIAAPYGGLVEVVRVPRGPTA